MGPCNENSNVTHSGFGRGYGAGRRSGRGNRGRWRLRTGSDFDTRELMLEEEISYLKGHLEKVQNELDRLKNKKDTKGSGKEE
jgi:hypothetical protein